MATVASMVVNLTANTSVFDRNMKRSMGTIQSFSAGIKTITTGLVGYFSVRAITGFVKTSINEFAKFEKGASDLTAALKNVGKEAEITALLKFSEEMQGVTTYAHDTITEVMKLGVTLAGLSGTQLTEATKTAIGLAQAYNIDLEAAMRLTSLGAAGVTARLKKLGIEMSKSASDQEVYNEILKRGAAGFAIAQSQVGTYSGKLAQMHNALADLKETIGSLIAGPAGGGLDFIKRWAEDSIEGINTMVVSIQNWGVTWDIITLTVRLGLLKLGNVIGNDLINDGIQMLIFAFQNWKTIGLISIDSIALGVVTLSMDFLLFCLHI
jgi:hypothetical protein